MNEEEYREIEELVVRYLKMNGPTRAHKLRWKISEIENKGYSLYQVAYVCRESEKIKKAAENGRNGHVWGLRT